MKPSGYFGHLDGSIPCPPPEQASEFALWNLIDGHLLSCITATILVSVLPHVLGLTQTQFVWNTLETRFVSLSRSHVHDLKRKLFDLRKTTTMEVYIDLL